MEIDYRSKALLSLLGNSGWSTAGDVIICDDTSTIIPTEVEIAIEIERLKSEHATNLVILEAKQYLKDTDWYITRLTETGTAIPLDVTALRTQARIDANEV